MAEFLTTSGISMHIEDIIIEAKQELILVSPYLQISRTLFQRLKDASDKGIKITIVYGKDQLNHKEHASLSELNSIFLYFSDNLHAKCYYNEYKMVITSMNMYEYSEKNKREMGVLINSRDDKDLYSKACQETQSIINFAKLEEQPTHKSSKKTSNFKPDNNSKSYNKNYTKVPTQHLGACIRCQEQIEHNTDRPYCYNCFNIWYQFENVDYDENYCHSCGNNQKSSMRRPQCRSCWSKYGTTEQLKM